MRSTATSSLCLPQSETRSRQVFCVVKRRRPGGEDGGAGEGRFICCVSLAILLLCCFVLLNMGDVRLLNVYIATCQEFHFLRGSCWCCCTPTDNILSFNQLLSKKSALEFWGVYPGICVFCSKKYDIFVASHYCCGSHKKDNGGGWGGVAICTGFDVVAFHAIYGGGWVSWLYFSLEGTLYMVWLLL